MNIEKAYQALKKYFGYEKFRSLQIEIIEQVYNKKDALVLMPTGGGKSICYQIPAVTMDGTCIVISPLISLMKDQVEGLKSIGISAAFINSSQSLKEQREIQSALLNKNLDLLYVSPEKVTSQDFLPILNNIDVSLIAVDEAHCISAWGHDFRPEYAKLKFLVDKFPQAPLLALTATADKTTREDIIQQLNLRKPEVFINSFDRPNLSLEVRPGRKKNEQIFEFVQERTTKPGIVYCLSRKNTESICAYLINNGIRAEFYHAGMNASERNRVQEMFIKDEVQVICATVAFGMGIDKSNVRWVIHYNLPKNIESYYQEIGRAGRDGIKAETLLFYSFGDLVILKDLMTNEAGSNAEVKLSKLNRMYQYASAVSCRRKILLNYFNELVEEDCGNCDNCKNPATTIDGTIIAQKLLSAVYRLKGKVAPGMLIDILRGSERQEIKRWGYHQIKTYGAGKDMSKVEWQQYFEQLLNQGLVEVNYAEYNKVNLTPLAEKVLFENEKVQLVQVEQIEARKKAKEVKIGKRFKSERVRDELFEHLRKLRIEISRKKGVPPYIIFNDATLEELAGKKPKTMEEMSQVSGIGEAKLRQYGRLFLNAIQEFLSQKRSEGMRMQGGTYLETLQLYKQGLTPEQIADQRELNTGTVISHLAHLYKEGERIQLSSFISKTEIQKVLKVVQGSEPPFKLKDIYDALEEALSYDKIKFALAYYERNVLRKT